MRNAALAMVLLGIASSLLAKPPKPEPRRMLAIGDSYTIGEGVSPEERWPVQLVKRLRERGLDVSEPAIVAKTGWTVDELSAGLDAVKMTGRFDLVTLLIGVNDQYRGRSAESYRTPFVAMLQRAIGFAGGNPKHVVVLSIPDWGVTPFAAKRDRAQIAQQLTEFNAVNRRETTKAGARYVDIWQIAKAMGTDPNLVVKDGLHPSGAMYRAWAEAAFDETWAALSGR